MSKISEILKTIGTFLQGLGDVDTTEYNTYGRNNFKAVKIIGTKDREYWRYRFAGMAMQAGLAAQSCTDARVCVQYADQLLAELKKTPAK